MKYGIDFKPKAVKDLRSLPKQIQSKILEKIQLMENDLNPELISKDGKPMFAVIPYEQFLAIKEMLEDFQDLQDLRAAKQEEYSQPAIALNNVKQMLGL